MYIIVPSYWKPPLPHSKFKIQNNLHTILNRQDLYGNENENTKMDPLRPVKHDCNEFSTVKYVPVT